jgi:hypothetical protein
MSVIKQELTQGQKHAVGFWIRNYAFQEIYVEVQSLEKGKTEKHLSFQSFKSQIILLFTRLWNGKCKAIPVTGRGGPYGCEMPRLLHFLDNRLTDGGEVVSLRRRPPFTLQELSWYSFLLEAVSTPGP